MAHFKTGFEGTRGRCKDFITMIQAIADRHDAEVEITPVRKGWFFARYEIKVIGENECIWDIQDLVKNVGEVEG
jgi:hypothetical protein